MTAKIPQLVQIRIHVFSSLQFVEDVITSRSLPYQLITVNNPSSDEDVIDAIFHVLACREEIAWLTRSFLTGWSEISDAEEKIKIHISMVDGTTICIDTSDVDSEIVRDLLGGGSRDTIGEITFSIGLQQDKHG